MLFQLLSPLDDSAFSNRMPCRWSGSLDFSMEVTPRGEAVLELNEKGSWRITGD